jgi:type III secretion system FlhB-like substrate exporter
MSRKDLLEAFKYCIPNDICRLLLMMIRETQFDSSDTEFETKTVFDAIRGCVPTDIPRIANAWVDKVLAYRTINTNELKKFLSACVPTDIPNLLRRWISIGLTITPEHFGYCIPSDVPALLPLVMDASRKKTVSAAAGSGGRSSDKATASSYFPIKKNTAAASKEKDSKQQMKKEKEEYDFNTAIALSLSDQSKKKKEVVASSAAAAASAVVDKKAPTEIEMNLNDVKIVPLEENDKRPECTICNTNIANIMNDGCGHVSICPECVKRCRAISTTCAVCRKPVTRWTGVFF